MNPLTTRQSASLVRQDEVKRGNTPLEPKAPPSRGGEAPTSKGAGVVTPAPDLDGEGLRIGIVRARFNEDIGQAELAAALAELAACGVDEEDVMVISVPGALELGVVLQQMAQTYAFDALIALGAVIRGETYHFEIVSNESAAAISRVAHEMEIPVLNGVLTTDTDAQAQARAAEKGRDCARGAVEMANLMAKFELLNGDDADDEDEDDDEQQSIQ